MGVPFLPVRGILGSVYPEVNPNLKIIPDPFGGDALVLVKALTPDAVLVHAGLGDEAGNILIPRVADWPLAIKAARTVIATVEKRVAGPLKDEAEWRLVPSIHLTALAVCPGGAHPTGFPGYYDQDEEEIGRYLKSAGDPAAWDDYLKSIMGQE